MTQIAEYSKTEAALAELRQRYEGVRFDMSTTAGDKQARAARQEVRGYRTSLEAMRKELKAPALERCRLIDDEAKRITAELLKLEEPIDQQIKAEEARREAEKAEKARIERERVAGIRAKIAEIQSIPPAAVGLSSATIQSVIDSTHRIEITADVFAEFLEEAEQAKAHAIDSLNDLHAKAVEHEAEQARLAAEREELQRLRAEQAERERIAAEQRAKAESEARVEREKAEAVLRAQREAQEAEARRVAEEQRRQQEELDRQRRELEEQRLAAERAEAERKAAAEAAERERAESAARAEREKAERKAREQFIEQGPDPRELVALIASHYDVTEAIAINWLARHEFGDLLAA